MHQDKVREVHSHPLSAETNTFHAATEMRPHKKEVAAETVGADNQTTAPYGVWSARSSVFAAALGPLAAIGSTLRSLLLRTG